MKPLVIFKAALSGRYYASRAYRPCGFNSNSFEVTGKKEDVTEQVKAIIQTESVERISQLEALLDEAEKALIKITEYGGWHENMPKVHKIARTTLAKIAEHKKKVT